MVKIFSVFLGDNIGSKLGLSLLSSNRLSQLVLFCCYGDTQYTRKERGYYLPQPLLSFALSSTGHLLCRVVSICDCHQHYARSISYAIRAELQSQRYSDEFSRQNRTFEEQVKQTLPAVGESSFKSNSFQY